MKLDTNGNYLWINTITGKFDELIPNTSLMVDDSNNICVTGRFGKTTTPLQLDSAYFGSTILSNVGADFFVAKYNANGNLIWAKNNGIPYVNGHGRKILKGEANTIFVIGGLAAGSSTTFLNQPITLPGNSNDVDFITLLDSNGVAKWVKIIFTTAFADGIQLNLGTVLPHNNLIVYGNYSCMNPLEIEGHASLGANKFTSTNTEICTFLVSYDSLGNCKWAKNPHGLIKGADGNRAIGIVNNHSDSSFYLTTNFISSTLSGVDTVFSKNNFSHVLIENLDNVGIKTWYKIINGDVSDFAYDVTMNDSLYIYILPD